MRQLVLNEPSGFRPMAVYVGFLRSSLAKECSERKKYGNLRVSSPVGFGAKAPHFH